MKGDARIDAMNLHEEEGDDDMEEDQLAGLARERQVANNPQ
jgi:hypothetical protein